MLNVPEFETTIPSTKERIRFRPFLVKEEKILFMALQGNDPNEMAFAVKKILDACVTTEQFSTDKLAISDVEYLFMQLRGKSVGETIELKVKHTSGDCDHVSDVEINIDDIEVIYPQDYTDKIQLTDEVGIQVRQPGVQDTTQLINTDDDFTKLISLISDCVICIYDNNNVYDTFTKEEIVQFLENLNQQQFSKVRDFFTNAPKMSYTINWTCEKCGKPDSVTVEGLSSFFM